MNTQYRKIHFLYTKMKCIFNVLGYLVGEHSAGLIPDDEKHWYRFLYCSALNALNLIVCLIGAGMFAKTTVFVLATVVVCIGITVVSYFVQGPMQVMLPDANTLIQNTTHMANYTGLRYETLQENLRSHYGLDYTAKGEPVTFATVFGVLFSGVTGIMAGANMSGML